MQKSRLLNTTVVVGALGYFVDIYDLLLFGIVRVASLRSLGVPEEQLLEKGVLLINAQMSGLLIGGILWGVLGDKKGRLSVLFGSILLYSLANIANAFVTSIELYAVLRFLAGIGLAGELGAAITLVSETLDKDRRGLGTTLVASIGILGAIFASIVGDVLSWQKAYFVGGVMGLALLFLRVSIAESGLFHQAKQVADLRKGDLTMLFHPPSRFYRYLRCILIGIPIWFVVGILLTFAPELSKELGIVGGPASAGHAIAYGYAGLSFGDLCSGLLSQYLRSRKKSVLTFIVLAAIAVALYLSLREISLSAFYGLCGFLGFGCGFWAVFMTIASEQFGTNLRSTVTTTVPNFVRGSVVLLTFLFQSLKPGFGLLASAALVGCVTFFIALLSLYFMDETFHRDLDFHEHG